MIGHIKKAIRKIRRAVSRNLSKSKKPCRCAAYKFPHRACKKCKR